MRLVVVGLFVVAALPSPAWAQDQPGCPPSAICDSFDFAPPLDPGVDDEASADAEVVEEAPETKGPIVLDPELRDWPTPAPKPEPPTVRGTVMTTGAVIFVSGYAVPFGVGALAGALADSDDTWAPLVPLLVPVAGPLITGALYDTPAPTWALLGADAGIQAVGLITLAVGAMMDEPDHRATARPTANGFLLRF